MKIRKAEGIEPEEWRLIVDAVVEMSRIPTAFTFSTRYVEDLVLAVKQRKDRDGLDILIVDYLQLLRTRQKTENERLTIAAISWALKCLSAECRIPVIALAQLRRPDSGQGNKMPTMRDLRESGNLEADADNIILLHEPESKSDPYVYDADKDYFDRMKGDGNRYIAMKVEKQRQGSTGVVSVLFRPNRMQYLPIDRG
jgi:replicative DNA helicase